VYPEGEPEPQPDEWPDDEEDGADAQPPSPWAAASEIAGGILALLAVSVGVIALYLAGGVALGLFSTAAPVILAMAAALLLARYLSRRPPPNGPPSQP
jgi:hypothetical protein